MKIQRVETFHFVGPVDRPYGPSCAYSYDRDAIIVKITTDEGLVGWGETYNIMAARHVIDREYTPKLIGQDPLDHRRIWHELWGPNFGNAFAISAVDIALADLRGKALGLSVSQLYGGAFRDRVPAYASGIPYYEGRAPEEYWVEDALALAERGFRAIKMRIGRYEPARELPILERVREALPSTVHLMADANAAYTLHTAIRVGMALDDLDFDWLEEPIREGDYLGYEVLTEQLAIPIAAGEIHLNRSDFSRFIEKRGARIVQPDVSIIGGLAELLFVGRDRPDRPDLHGPALQRGRHLPCCQPPPVRAHRAIPRPCRGQRSRSSNSRRPSRSSTRGCLPRPSRSMPTAWSRCRPARGSASRSTRMSCATMPPIDVRSSPCF